MSHTNTPRNLATPRGTGRDRNGFTAPNTPRTPHATPKRAPKTPLPSGTPDCFNNVVLETPNSAKRIRSSKDKGDEVSNLSVAVRIRPMNSRELSHVGATNVVHVENNELSVKLSPIGNATVSMDHVFYYDHIFWSCDESHKYSSQETVFKTLGVPLLDSAFEGYNACLFAYGQTGSGKSFSMMGRSENDLESDEYSGIIPRFCRELFKRIGNLPDNSSATLDVSYFEIYNEKIHDLLLENTSKIGLKVREHPMLGPYVENLSVNSVKTYNELRNWLLIGNKNRATAATSMNEKSSRSHSIFSIDLSLTEGLGDNNDGSGRRSRVSLVDLAGSERLSNSHNNEEKIRQGVSINKSLLTLGKVISSLADQKKNPFVPYRDSVLTWLLKESLGGNSMTTMLATITPSNLHADETLATLRYACQARSIVNRARINENPHEKLIRELRSEVLRLRSIKKSYERMSLGSNTSLQSNLSSNTSGYEEMEDLRHKLNETEHKLHEAEKVWERKFHENRASQLRQLSEMEKQKEELESRVRIMENADVDVDISPYRSNFLEELEGVLETAQDIHDCQQFQRIINWCKSNNLNYSINRNALLIIDYKNNKQTIITLQDMESLDQNNVDVGDFLNNLTWDTNKTNTKLTKQDVLKGMNTIYQALSDLTPPSEDQSLSLLYAKISKSLQKYETALLANLSAKNTPKSVKFDL